MKKLFSITALNLLQGIKEKIFWLVIFFFIFILGMTFFMGILSTGETNSVLRSAGLSGIEIMGILLVVFSLIFNFYKEKDSAITELFLVHFSKSVYLGGKFLGYIFICVVYLILASLGWSLILIINQAFSWYVLAGVFMILLKLSIIIGMALVCCCFFTSPLIAFISTFFLCAAGEFSQSAVRIMALNQDKLSSRAFQFLYYILPNMDKFDIKSQIIHESLPSFNYFMGIIIYTFTYTIFLWCLSVFIFSKKEI